MAPISSFSLSIGTIRSVRAPRELGDRFIGAFRREIGNVDHLLRAHESIEAGRGGAPDDGALSLKSANFRGALCSATRRKGSAVA